MRVLAVTALVLALAACGGSAPRPLTAAQKSVCVVRIFFSQAATQAQERFVGAKLRGDARVARVTFTSKAQALAFMKKKAPYLFKVKVPGMLKNVLPDAYTALPVQLSDLPPLGKAVTAAHWPGVGNVIWGSSLNRSLCGGASG